MSIPQVLIQFWEMAWGSKLDSREDQNGETSIQRIRGETASSFWASRSLQNANRLGHSRYLIL